MNTEIISKVFVIAIVAPFIVKAIIDTIFWMLESIPWFSSEAHAPIIVVLKRALSLLLGLAAPWIFQVGILSIVNIPINQVADYVITGLLLARGSNIINDFLSLFSTNHSSTIPPSIKEKE